MASVKDFKDNILVTTTSTGTGTLTQGAAVANFAAPAAGDDGKTFAINVYEVDANGNPSGAWEVTESVYTHSGTTWSRGTFLGSSTGSRINFAAGNKRIAVVVPADVLSQLAYLNGKSGGQILCGGTTGGSLTLASNATQEAAGSHAVLTSASFSFYVAGTRFALLSDAPVFNRSVEVGTDPGGAIPGPAGFLRMWTNDGVAAEPVAAVDRVIAYAWDYAAADTRLKIKSESGGAVWIGSGTISGSNSAADVVLVISGSAAGGQVQLSDAVALTAAIAPASITSDQNNYSPSGFGATVVVGITTDDDSRYITGLVPGTNSIGKLALLFNVGSFNLNLSHENAGSTAANRFSLPSGLDVVIEPGGGLMLWYDTTSSRWRAVVERDSALITRGQAAVMKCALA